MEPERRQHKYRKTVSYDLEITRQEQSLLIEMEVLEDQKTKPYRLQLYQEDISRELQRYTPSIDNVFSLMGREDNFQVRPIEGKIDLILPSRNRRPLKHTLSLLNFESEMKIVKAGWEEKKKTMEKKNIEWEFKDNYGNKYGGKYEGEVKGGVPHGLGKWKRDGGNRTVEGEWEDGLLNGRVVQNYGEERD